MCLPSAVSSRTMSTRDAAAFVCSSCRDVSPSAHMCSMLGHRAGPVKPVTPPCQDGRSVPCHMPSNGVSNQFSRVHAFRPGCGRLQPSRDRKQAPSTSPGTTYCPLIEKNFEQRTGENPHPSLPQQTGEGAGDPRPSAEAAAMQRSPLKGEEVLGRAVMVVCERCHRYATDPLRGRQKLINVPLFRASPA